MRIFKYNIKIQPFSKVALLSISLDKDKLYLTLHLGVKYKFWHFCFGGYGYDCIQEYFCGPIFAFIKMDNS
jgi:hypothetical protein